VAYEDVAAEPEAVLERISHFLEIPYEPEAVNYGQAQVEGSGLGDPIGVGQHSRPVTTSIAKWAPELAADEEKFSVVAKQLAGVAAEDLAAWGYPKDSLWAPMKEADPTAYTAKKRKFDRWAVQRAVLVWLRRDIHNRWIGKLVRKVRFICDVLLRG
jgi:hypothetical protein